VSSADWAYLASLTGSQFQNGGHRSLWQPTMTAIAATATDVGNLATITLGYAQSSAASYAAQLALAGGTQGIGTEELDLVLKALLGSGAFVDVERLIARRPVTTNSDYQILPQDFFNAMLLTTSGTRTYTLPDWSSLPLYVPPLLGKNRSGNNLTIQRSGTDVIDNAATSVTVPTGSSWEIYRDGGTGQFESRVFA
jgi:hypothetical protein